MPAPDLPQKRKLYGSASSSGDPFGRPVDGDLQSKGRVLAFIPSVNQLQVSIHVNAKCIWFTVGFEPPGFGKKGKDKCTGNKNPEDSLRAIAGKGQEQLKGKAPTTEKGAKGKGTPETEGKGTGKKGAIKGDLSEKGAGKDMEKGKGKETEKGKGKDMEKGKGKDMELKGKGKDMEKGKGKDTEKGKGKDIEKGKGKDVELKGKGKDMEKGKGKDTEKGKGKDMELKGKGKDTEKGKGKDAEKGKGKETAEKGNGKDTEKGKGKVMDHGKGKGMGGKCNDMEKGKGKDMEKGKGKDTEGDAAPATPPPRRLYLPGMSPQSKGSKGLSSEAGSSAPTSTSTELAVPGKWFAWFAVAFGGPKKRTVALDSIPYMHGQYTLSVVMERWIQENRSRMRRRFLSALAQ